MEINYGEGKTKYGPGVSIELTGDEVASAISSYLVAHDVYFRGPRTITVNGALCETGRVYVDPLGIVVANGQRFSGRGPSRGVTVDVNTGVKYSNLERVYYEAEERAIAMEELDKAGVARLGEDGKELSILGRILKFKDM